MRSVLRSVKKRKKSRRLGAVDVISREAYAGFEVDAKVEMIRALVPRLMLVQELLDEEVTALAGARHARKGASTRGRRHGSNPGTVRLAGQRVPIRVPRVRGVTGGEIPLRSYEAARGDGQVHDVLLKRVLYGISSRNYEAAAESVPGAIGLSSSTVSRSSIQASAADAPGVSGARLGPVRTWWPCFWTARLSPIRRWSSRWASRCPGRNASWVSWRRTRRTRRF